MNHFWQCDIDIVTCQIWSESETYSKIRVSLSICDTTHLVQLEYIFSEGVVECFSINTLSFGYKCSYYSAGEIYKYLRLSQMHTMHIFVVVNIHKSCSIDGHGVYQYITQKKLAKKSKLHKFYHKCVIDPGCAVYPLKTVCNSLLC